MSAASRRARSQAWPDSWSATIRSRVAASSARTNSVVTPLGSVDPSSPARGPLQITRHWAGQWIPATIPAQSVAPAVVAAGAVAAGGGLVVVVVVVVVVGRVVVGTGFAIVGGVTRVAAALLRAVRGVTDRTRPVLVTTVSARYEPGSVTAPNAPLLMSAVHIQSTTPRRRRNLRSRVNTGRNHRGPSEPEAH
jgi:hypothetical protein